MKHARQDYDRIQDPTGKIPANEPVFLLRGQDICAPFAVMAWADEAEKRGADAEIVRKARAWAAEMLTYQADKKSKVPDCPKYQVPDIAAGLGFRIITSNGLYYIQEVYDTTPTCLVIAYDNAGVYLWRDRWVVDELRKNFESGECWEVRVGELTDGRRVALMDPGPIQTPYEALMGEPPASWRPGGPKMADKKPITDAKGFLFVAGNGEILWALHDGAKYCFCEWDGNAWIGWKVEESAVIEAGHTQLPIFLDHFIRSIHPTE